LALTRSFAKSNGIVAKLIQAEAARGATRGRRALEFGIDNAFHCHFAARCPQNARYIVWPTLLNWNAIVLGIPLNALYLEQPSGGIALA
jgi:hypothetical protein